MEQRRVPRDASLGSGSQPPSAMLRDWRIARASVALALALAAVGCGWENGPPSSPNVILYVVDTLRADALSAYGHDRIQTPHTDRLAAEGVLFERAYSAAPWTRPSVASLLTGIDPDGLGVEGRNQALPRDVPLLPQVFKIHGYRTASFVANPNVGTFFGFGRGVDEFFSLYERQRAGVVGAEELVATSDELADQVVAWLGSATEPFFLFVLAIDPHGPYRPPASFDRYHGTAPRLPPEMQEPYARYLGEVAFADQGLGRVLEKLDDRGLTERTLVVFTSDHGEEFEEHGARGHGTGLYEETQRVPLILRFPAEIPAGERVEYPVQGVDVAPTLLALSGLPVPGRLDGRPLLGPDSSVPPAAYSSLGLDHHEGSSLTAYPWKLVLGARTGGAALFDLESDPGEAINRAATHPTEFRQVLELLERRRARNAERAGRQVPREVPPERLPASAREALEALGYLEEPVRGPGSE